jgi:hypothetical protein
MVDDLIGNLIAGGPADCGGGSDTILNFILGLIHSY